MFRWLKYGNFVKNFSNINSNVNVNVKKRNSIGRLISLNNNNTNTSEKLQQHQFINQSQKNNSIISVISSKRPLYPILAACTAESYDFSKLLPYLQKNFQLSPFICDEVLHIRFDDKAEVFFFKNGSLVYWSSDSGSNVETIGTILKNDLLPTLKPFEISPFNEPDFEELSYKILPSNTNGSVTGIVDETVILNEETVSIKDKLAFSNGLADSVKLGVLERMMDDHIEKVKNIPSALMNKGKIALGRREMLSLTGELLHFRAQLNLNSDLMDTPDIYWSEPKLEDLYTRISRVLETRRRIAVLNKKLDYAKEMAQVLSEHLAEQHGLKLEWGIIALIAVEVAFETFHLIGKLIQ